MVTYAMTLDLPLALLTPAVQRYSSNSSSPSPSNAHLLGAFSSLLCFHDLTNCFSRSAFLFTTIRIAPGVASHSSNSNAINAQSRPLSLPLGTEHGRSAPFSARISAGFAPVHSTAGPEPHINYDP